jgi:hypothetical protein
MGLPHCRVRDQDLSAESKAYKWPHPVLGSNYHRFSCHYWPSGCWFSHRKKNQSVLIKKLGFRAHKKHNHRRHITYLFLFNFFFHIWFSFIFLQFFSFSFLFNCSLFYTYSYLFGVFLVGLGSEFKALTFKAGTLPLVLSHTSLHFSLVFGDGKVFAQSGFEPQSSWSQPPK